MYKMILNDKFTADKEKVSKDINFFDIENSSFECLLMNRKIKERYFFSLEFLSNKYWPCLKIDIFFFAASLPSYKL